MKSRKSLSLLQWSSPPWIQVRTKLTGSQSPKIWYSFHRSNQHTNIQRTQRYLVEWRSRHSLYNMCSKRAKQQDVVKTTSCDFAAGRFCNYFLVTSSRVQWRPGTAGYLETSRSRQATRLHEVSTPRNSLAHNPCKTTTSRFYTSDCVRINKRYNVLICEYKCIFFLLWTVPG